MGQIAPKAYLLTLILALMPMMLVAWLPARTARAQSTMSQPGDSSTTSELTVLLREFLDKAGRGDRVIFERFFADDVIYTRSSGIVTNKADILRGMEKQKSIEESNTRYSAEDIVIHEYGDTAVVAFRLVAETQHPGDKPELVTYRNTGTFLRRQGVWQVVAWQSTKAASSIQKRIAESANESASGRR